VSSGDFYSTEDTDFASGMHCSGGTVPPIRMAHRARCGEVKPRTSRVAGHGGRRERFIDMHGYTQGLMAPAHDRPDDGDVDSITGP
jgi:hypothetical protein